MFHFLHRLCLCRPSKECSFLLSEMHSFRYCQLLLSRLALSKVMHVDDHITSFQCKCNLLFAWEMSNNTYIGSLDASRFQSIWYFALGNVFFPTHSFASLVLYPILSILNCSFKYQSTFNALGIQSMAFNLISQPFFS